MKKPSLVFALAVLLNGQIASAEVSVVSEQFYPETCSYDDYNRKWCSGGSEGKTVLVYTSAEMNAINSAFNDRLARLQTDGDTLRSQVAQRDKDIQTLSSKADLAEKRYLELLKQINEISGHPPAFAPKTPKPRSHSKPK